MTSFRKRPVLVEAVQWTGDNLDEVLALGLTVTPAHNRTIEIRTLEGTMTAIPGDYIIKGIEGEFYPCKPTIFDESYELVTEEPDGEDEDD